MSIVIEVIGNLDVKQCKRTFDEVGIDFHLVHQCKSEVHSFEVNETEQANTIIDALATMKVDYTIRH